MINHLGVSSYRVMRMRLKAQCHSTTPRAAMDLLERIQQHLTRIVAATKTTLSHRPACSLCHVRKSLFTPLI